MKKVYRFRYDKKSDFLNQKINKEAPFVITIFVLWILAFSLNFVFDFFGDAIPVGVSLTTLILAIVMTAIDFATLVYYIYHWYNNSITETHWDFNQEITIEGNRIVSRLTFGEDTLTEELSIKKIIKKKKVTLYYQDRHHYVSIPNSIVPVSEEEGNQE